MARLDPIDEGREGSPFSNGTEGFAWVANWCDRCIHDKPAREDQYEDACGIFTLSLTGRTPSEWIEQEWGEKGPPVDRYHCVMFRDEDDGPPPPTEPEPTPPGQGELLPMEDFVGSRMFVDMVNPVRTTEVPS